MRKLVRIVGVSGCLGAAWLGAGCEPAAMVETPAEPARASAPEETAGAAQAGGGTGAARGATRTGGGGGTDAGASGGARGVAGGGASRVAGGGASGVAGGGTTGGASTRAASELVTVSEFSIRDAGVGLLRVFPPDDRGPSADALWARDLHTHAVGLQTREMLSRALLRPEARATAWYRAFEDDQEAALSALVERLVVRVPPGSGLIALQLLGPATASDRAAIVTAVGNNYIERSGVSVADDVFRRTQRLQSLKMRLEAEWRGRVGDVESLDALEATPANLRKREQAMVEERSTRERLRAVIDEAAELALSGANARVGWYLQPSQ